MTWDNVTKITPDSFDQLIRVINFAHDKGGKRVVIINRTDYFSHDDLIRQIITQLPDREKTNNRSITTTVRASIDPKILTMN